MGLVCATAENERRQGILSWGADRILIRVDGAPGLAMFSKVADLTTGGSLIAALDR